MKKLLKPLDKAVSPGDPIFKRCCQIYAPSEEIIEHLKIQLDLTF